jgi:hypothetical protein
MKELEKLVRSVVRDEISKSKKELTPAQKAWKTRRQRAAKSGNLS